MTEIYLDSAATSLHKPPQVARAVAEAICTAGNAARGAHGASMAASRTVYDTRCLVARLLGCPRPDHVAFTANSTMALNMAISGLLTPEDHAVSTDLEHNSVLRPLYALQRQGMGLSFLPADGNGRLDYDALEGLFRPDTRAVVCTHASNVTGDMPDIPRIAALAHAHGALLILDASQTAGAVPLGMTALGADVLCFTGHKSLLGPQGTGGLCIRPGVELRPLLRGGSGPAAVLRFASDYLTVNARVIDPCCGSGTLLFERGMLSPCASLTGVDISHKAIDCARVNAEAAVKTCGITQAKFICNDIMRFESKRPYDELICNLPFGNRVGNHSSCERLYEGLLDRMGLLVKKGGIAVLYTMEFTLLKNLIRERRNIEILKQERTEAGGLTPMIFILRVKE